MSKKKTPPRGQLSWIQPAADQLSLDFTEKETAMNEIEAQYPLLTAWQSGRLRETWNQEREAMKKQDPKLLDWVVDHTAAARLSAHLTAQYQKLRWKAEWLVRRYQSDPNYTDAVIEFYDALQDDKLKSYRAELQDISGNRSLIADEIQYSSSVAFQEE